MKINLAVYTAQEGYSWQPGTVFTLDELIEFKKCIGRFPKPDSSDFPFGGIFLLDDRVVFYRYHVAKKIDFCGRDALYCVLGAVSRTEAAKIVPAALFASPEFAGPMKPFPTALELSEAESSVVPEWLKNLDRNTLDVRITGSVQNPNYAVAQEPVEIPQPPTDTGKKTPIGDSGAITPAGDADGDEATTDKSRVPVPTGGSGTVARPEQPPASESVKKLSLWMIVGVVVLVLLIVGLSGGAVWYCLKRHASSQTSTADVSGVVINPVPVKTAVATPTNAPEAVAKQPRAPATNHVSVIALLTKSPAPITAPQKNALQPPPEKDCHDGCHG